MERYSHTTVDSKEPQPTQEEKDARDEALYQKGKELYDRWVDTRERLSEEDMRAIMAHPGVVEEHHHKQFFLAELDIFRRKRIDDERNKNKKRIEAIEALIGNNPEAQNSDKEVAPNTTQTRERKRWWDRFRRK